MANKYKPLVIPNDSAWSRTSFYTKYFPIWFKEFIVSLKNLKVWFTIIYFDRNWDYGFIYLILEKKLLLQRKELVNANRHEGVEKINRYITICLNLLDKIKNDYYSLEYFDYHEGNGEMTPIDPNNLNKGYTWDYVLISSNFDAYFRIYPNTVRRNSPFKDKPYNEVTVEEKHKFALTLGRINEEKARKLLFKILFEKIEYWWD